MSKSIKLKNNIYWSEESIGVTLFSGSLCGVDIPLNDSLNNYKYIEITYGTPWGGLRTKKVKVSGTSDLIITEEEMDTATNNYGIVYINNKFHLDNNYLRFAGNIRTYKYETDTNWQQDRVNPIAIEKVVGYN